MVVATQKTGAVHIDMPAEKYHEHPAIGASMIEIFRRSRREFYQRFVECEEVPAKRTDPMDLGTLIHARLLEPLRFEELLAPQFPSTNEAGEEWNWRKPAHRDERDAWYAKHADGKIVISEEERTDLDKIIGAVLNNQHARRLLEREGKSEYSIFWTDYETGLNLKCRVDWFSSIPLDLKSSADVSPAEYSRQIVKLGYHRKLAHYLDGIAAHVGEPVPMVHLAVETKTPYRVATYDINDADLRGRSLGERQRRELLRQIQKCYADNDWREPWEKQIVSLSLPRWAFSEDEFYLGD